MNGSLREPGLLVLVGRRVPVGASLAERRSRGSQVSAGQATASTRQGRRLVLLCRGVAARPKRAGKW